MMVIVAPTLQSMSLLFFLQTDCDITLLWLTLAFGLCANLVVGRCWDRNAHGLKSW